MSSVENLAAKVRDRAGSDSNEGHIGQDKAFQQIQDMFNKQAEEIKAFQHSMQLSKVTNSPPASRPSGHARSYLDAALASHLTSIEPSKVAGWMRSATNGSVGTNGALSTSPSNPATPFPLKEDLEIHIRGTDRQIVDPLRHHKEAKVVERANCAIKESKNTGITH